MCNYNECCPDNNNSNCPDSGGGTQTIYVNSVSVAPGSVTLNVGEWFYGAYAEICPLNADCRNVRWYSDDPDVASVGETSGYICANSAGTARIYAEATDGSGCSDYLTVTVSSRIYVDSVSLDYSSISIEEGQNVYITATVCPGNASNKNLNWTSSNTSVARVSGGVVTGVSKGTARITATAADGSGKSASCLVSVTRDILVASIELTPSDKTLKVGYSFFPSVTVCPADATEKSVTWSSANSNIASVNPNSGLVYAKAVGTTTIYATASDGSGVCGCCTVRVVPVYVQDITVCPESLTLDVGERYCLEATVYPVNATNPNVCWTSGDCNIADVDSNGCVTAKSAGTTCICAYATDGSGVHGCCEVMCNIPNGMHSGTDSIGVFQTLSLLGTTPENTETGAPVIRGVQFRERQNGNYDIRFVSQIKTLNYKSVGYEIHYKFGNDAPVANPLCSEVVYTSLIADGKTVYPDNGFEFFVVGVIENVPQNTVASFKIKPFATTLAGDFLYGSTTLFTCKDAQPINYYYISSKTDTTGDKVISYKNALDGALNGVSSRADVCVEPLTRVGKQIWCITNISDITDGQIKAYFDEDYGFNAYRNTTGNFNCDLVKVDGNADANVRFVNQGNGYYKIRLASDQYSDYYLTLDANSNDVRWQNTDEGDRQLWKLNVVDWEQYENEHKEYHLLCNGDTNKALRVATTNLLLLEANKPVRGERISYWNRQKWTIKGTGTKKKIYTRFNSEYYLCNDGLGNVYVANNASDDNSHLIISLYENTGKYTIRLSNDNLYLTLVYNDSDSLYWGKWCNFNSDDPSMQLWELKEQPETNHLGVDTNKQISNTTAKILKKEGVDFAIKYYATRDNINSWNYGKILTESEVNALHNAGLKIIVVYEDGGINFSEERGKSDATEALRLATLLGQPQGSAIYFGVEPEANDLSLIEDYFKAVKSVIDSDGRFKVGVYGIAAVCSAIKYNKETNSGYADYTWLCQVTGNATAEGDNSYINYDKNKEYDIKQSDQIYYNEILFDNDTSIVDQYGQW